VDARVCVRTSGLAAAGFTGKTPTDRTSSPTRVDRSLAGTLIRLKIILFFVFGAERWRTLDARRRTHYEQNVVLVGTRFA
jgi:hypothetical protein